jgi:hypothetical protein
MTVQFFVVEIEIQIASLWSVDDLAFQKLVFPLEMWQQALPSSAHSTVKNVPTRAAD